MIHEHQWVLAQSLYERYEVGPRHALSMDEVDVYVRGKQIWRCSCGESNVVLVKGLEPGTEPHPPTDPLDSDNR